MDPPLEQKPLSEDKDAHEHNLIDWRAVVPLATHLAEGGTPTPQDGILPTDSTADLKRPDDDLECRLRRLSRRGFTLGGVAALAGLSGWRWLVTRGEEGEL